jgi:thiol-disulfide isomerase/thioredoxin
LIDRFEANSRSGTEQAGVGVAWARRNGQLFVARVLPDTPAAQSGKVREGDRLVAVGQGSQPPVDVKGMSINQVVPMIRGTNGTVVTLTIIPAGKAEADAVVVPLRRAVMKELNFFGDGHLIPLGTKAPGFDAVLLSGSGKYQLKSDRGRIVVLEFWASWCGPCLKGVDHLQDLREQHPEWKDHVQFVAVGIDDEREAALRCFKQRGERWTNIRVVWAGPRALKLFHVAHFPGSYVLDERGTVVATDFQTDLSTVINKALSGASSAK